MAFPTSNLHLSTVCSAYNVTPASMNGLRGKTYYNTAGTPSTIPTSGDFLLSSLFGKYSLDPTPILNQAVTSTPIALPAGRPTPTGFVITLNGASGGGGGGGGSFIAYGGGSGGAGGGGAQVITGTIPYNQTLFSALTITFPTTAGTAGGGGGGSSGGPLPGSGAGGGVGGNAVLVYNGTTYTANGGAGGSGGGGGNYTSQGGDGAAGAGGVASPSGTNGTNGAGGAGGGGGFPDGNNGNSGTAGTAGSVLISWYFT